MEALLSQRIDLGGLPFAMGDSCRLGEERARQFALALSSLNTSRFGPAPAPPIPIPSAAKLAPPPPPPGPTFEQPVPASDAGMPMHPGDVLMESFRKQHADNRLDPRAEQHAHPARVAALTAISPGGPFGLAGTDGVGYRTDRAGMAQVVG